jgi:isopentenyl-diphosphate Delta-isomerase
LNTLSPDFADSDANAAERKKDHIELAFRSQVSQTDGRFYYEPLLAAHPTSTDCLPTYLGKKKLNFPIWVSSMTGGTDWARHINQNLARLCGEYGLGMGLGSCRALLTEDTYLPDFDVRKYIGEQPLYANLGIAQVEVLLLQNKTHLISQLIDKLQADGLILHINPMQEWLQPEGDRYTLPPLTTILRLIEKLPNMSLIVKEVGQGMGKESLRELFQLPLTAVDFAASGGTNFALLELLRSDAQAQAHYQNLAYIGHTAEEMVGFTNQILSEIGDKRQCHQVIISGGVKDFLDGYYLTQKSQLPALYGQASAFLKYAQKSYEELQEFAQRQTQGLLLASKFLKIR